MSLEKQIVKTERELEKLKTEKDMLDKCGFKRGDIVWQKIVGKGFISRVYVNMDTKSIKAYIIYLTKTDDGHDHGWFKIEELILYSKHVETLYGE